MNYDRCFHLLEAGDVNEMLLNAGYSDVDPVSYPA